MLFQIYWIRDRQSTLQYRYSFSFVSDRLLFEIRRQELFGEVYWQTYTVHREGYIADAL